MDNTHRHTLLAALLFSVASLPAQTGHWEGSMEGRTATLNFAVDLARDSAGGLAGTFDQPAENVKGLPLSNVTVDGESVRFQIKGTPGERAFKGALSTDGKSISGTYTQSGYSILFKMTRTGDARIEAAVKNAALPKEFEGVWNGTVEADGQQLRAVLTLSNQPDGTATGNILSLNDGLEIPISTIMQKASGLTLELKAVGASYSGALNPDRSELAGTYTKGPLALPLTFQRATATEGNK